jgi:ring-1,2-phenylacetyl-CoA epoxidase subunit PaaD
MGDMMGNELNDREAMRAAVNRVPDPEMGGVTIGDLGLVVDVVVGEDGACEVTLTPTFLGCPALNLIRADVERALLQVGASTVSVTWLHHPAWTPTRITANGRTRLAELGIAVAGFDDFSTMPPCPTCGQPELASAAAVGPTSCRSVAWCNSCRSVIEIMRGPIHAVPVGMSSPVKITPNAPRARNSYAHL